MTPDPRLGIYRHGDAITHLHAVDLMALPGAEAWGVAYVLMEGYGPLMVVHLARATYAQAQACDTWALRHRHEINRRRAA